MFSDLKILLTGSTGFIGSRLKIQLESMGFDVFCLDRSKVNVLNLTELVPYLLKNVGKSFVIIHTAAMSDTNECEKNKVEAYKANVIYTQNLAHFAIDFDCYMIFLSSDQVYDYFNEKEHYEYNPVHPTNYYGLTKMWAENSIREILPRHFILRLTWQFDFINPTLPNKGIFVNLVEKGKNGEQIVASKKSFRYITWVNVTILHIIRFMSMGFPYGTYNIASVTDKSIYEIYKFILQKLKIKNINASLKSDSKLKPINLTPYPYALANMGVEITNLEDTIDKMIIEKAKNKMKQFK